MCHEPEQGSRTGFKYCIQMVITAVLMGIRVPVLTAELVAAEHQHLQVPESPEREGNIDCGIRTQSENRKLYCILT